jgi:hypothetical protein
MSVHRVSRDSYFDNASTTSTGFGGRTVTQPAQSPNNTFDRTAGSHSLAAAGQRGRSAQMTAVGVTWDGGELVPSRWRFSHDQGPEEGVRGRIAPSRR